MRSEKPIHSQRAVPQRTVRRSGLRAHPWKPPVTVLPARRVTVRWCFSAGHTREIGRWRRLDDIHKLRNRFDYGDIIDVPGVQVETLIADAETLLADVLKAFPTLRPR